MKILLDECVTKRLKQYLPDHDVFTVTQMRWNGLRNGVLMSKAVENNFDLLLSIDKNIQHQQNFSRLDLIVVILDSLSSKIEHISLYIPEFYNQLNSFQKGRVYVISV